MNKVGQKVTSFYQAASKAIKESNHTWGNMEAINFTFWLSKELYLPSHHFNIIILIGNWGQSPKNMASILFWAQAHKAARYQILPNTKHL